jgi:hypothetical protein
VWTTVPTGKVKEAAAMLKAIHAQEDAKAAKEKARQVVEKLHAMRLAKAAEIIEAGIDETLSYFNMPSEHWRSIKTNNPLERLIREIRRRTRVVGAFPDGHSASMVVAARLRHVAATKWGTKRYLQMNRLALGRGHRITLALSNQARAKATTKTTTSQQRKKVRKTLDTIWTLPVPDQQAERSPQNTRRRLGDGELILCNQVF